MHFVFLLLLLVFLAYLLVSRGQLGRGNAAMTRPESDVDISENLSLLYLSDGKLFSKEKTGKLGQIESHFVEEGKARAEKSKSLAGWKEGTTWDTSFAQMRGMGERHEDSNIQFSSVVRADENRLLYFLRGAGFGGLFEYNIESGKELRLMHRQNIDYRDLSKPNSEHQFLVSSHQENGVANIATLSADGNTYREITGGDTVDTAPSWVVNETNQLVYQSQGIARDPQGFIKGLGPSEITLLDTDTGDLSTVFSETDHDYLKPMVTNSGALYFIKRPYEGSSYSNGNVILDALLFPFRLLRAVFHYLNFFSMMYSRKPLISAGGPAMNQDVKEMVIQGRKIDTEKALRKRMSVHNTPSLVPADWVLIRCDKNGGQELMATHVASYDVTPTGELIYSNGCATFCIQPNGQHKKVAQDRLIQDVLI